MDLDLIFTASLHEEGAWMTVKDAAGDKTSVRIKLMGVHSKQWRETKRLREAQQQIYLKLIDLGKTKEADDYYSEMLSEEDLMARVTMDWENMPDPNEATRGQDFKFSEDNAKLIYTLAPHILDQCDKFFTNAVNFTKRSASKSESTLSGPSTHTEEESTTENQG